MTISQALSSFAAGLRYDVIPASVARHARLLMLDATGVAFASSKFDFAQIACTGMSAFGPGATPVIGLSRTLSLRDAVLLNGMLIHGLDYDDTYLPGSVHMTCSNVPCALGVAGDAHTTGREFLTACVIGLETGARIGLAGKAAFAQAGFQPTSVCGTMSSSLVAGRLTALDQDGLERAQGIALSMAGGSMQAAQDGTWAKRMQPGWAAAAGITAAALARSGFSGPAAAYEGRYGFYHMFLGVRAADAQPSLIVDGLRERWEFVRSSFKLYPACHQSHAFMNAAIRIAMEHDLHADQIESVTTLVAEITRDLVCEPAAAKVRPESSYLAQFSLPYAMAACLVRRRFGLPEIEPSAYTDPELIHLAQKVRYEIDPNAGFPKTRSGEVIVRLRDGREFRARDEIRPDEPASEAAIVAKFMMNAESAMPAPRACEIRDRILSIENEVDMGEFCRLLS